MIRRWPFALVVVCASAASADPYDLSLAKLGNPQEGGFAYSARADGNFRVFARQFAAALTSVNLAPPETLGHSAFSVSAEMSIVDFAIPSSGDYRLPTTSAYQGPMKLFSLHLRKGLPSSFELGARGTYIEQSRMGAATLELKWALNEGFTYLPDIGVRGLVTKLINGRDIDLTAGGIDLGIGKQFAVGGMVTITPYIGWNLLFVGATSNTIDFHPSRTIEEADAPADQFKDYYVFTSLQAAANAHNRFYGGFRFIAGVVQLGAEVSYSAIGRFHDSKANEERDVPSVFAFNWTLGLDF